MLRKERSLTQKQVAEACGISTYGYQRYEYGERKPVISVAIKLAEFFTVSLDYLAGLSDNPKIK